MNARTRPGVPWRRAVLAVIAASGLALGAATAAAEPGHPSAVRAATGAKAVRAPAVNACDPTASSLRPSGPPQVTPGSFMAKIRARGYLIAGVDQSTYHFGFLNPLSGQIEGFDIDMIRAVAKAIFGDPGKVQFKAISDEQRIPDTTDGTVDIVAHTMTITCDRLKMVDFSSVYFEAHQKVLVLKNSSATSLDDLHGQKVCATSGIRLGRPHPPAQGHCGPGAVLDRLPGAAAAGRAWRRSPPTTRSWTGWPRRIRGPRSSVSRSPTSPTAWRSPSSTRSSSGS